MKKQNEMYLFYQPGKERRVNFFHLTFVFNGAGLHFMLIGAETMPVNVCALLGMCV